MSALKEQKCWVVFRYKDNSIIYLYTTLNEELLSGIPKVPDSFYDFNKNSWISMNTVQGAVVEIYTEKPQLEEVDVFANTFIK